MLCTPWIDDTINTIRGRERMEIALRESEQRLADIIDFLPDPTLAVDLEGRIIVWNRAIEKVTGLPKSGILGKGSQACALSFYGKERPLLIDFFLTGSSEVENFYSYVKHQEKRIVAEGYVPMFNDGTGAYLWGIAAPLYDRAGNMIGAIESIRDITEQKQDKEKLKSAHAALRGREQVIEAQNEELLSKGRDLMLANRNLNDMNIKLQANEQNLTMAIDICGSTIWEHDLITGEVVIKRYPGESKLGYTIEELPVHSEGFMHLIHPDCWESMQSALAAYLRGETATYETEICLRSKSGEWVWAYVFGKITQYASDGSPKKILGISIDITQIKKAREEVRNAQAQLIQADKMIALGTLVSGVAHEINNPNNFVMLNTPLVQETWKGIMPVLEAYYRVYGDFKAGGMLYSKLRDGVPTLLNGILDGAHRIRNIVKELKDFARPDDVSISQTVDINTVLNSAITLLGNGINKSTKLFTVRYGKDLPVITGNNQRLEQVFINLIQNACQALPDPHRGIQVATAYDGHNITVTIRDEGIGIPQEYINQIMTPFFTTKRGGGGGTGLGLSISHKIISDHGGRIDVQSREGKGSTFTVLLPLKPAENRNKILIADDDASIREIMFDVLSQDASYDIRTVENGTDACIILGMWHPDLIVLDINMPDMNGMEVCRRIKKDPHFSNVQVIIVTGFPESWEMQEIKKMGFTDFVTKPFRPQELHDMVAMVLNKILQTCGGSGLS